MPSDRKARKIVTHVDEQSHARQGVAIPDRIELLKHMEFMLARIHNHHSALWEEEKHYSWWVYILFAGLIYLYSTTGWEKGTTRYMIIAVSIIGMIVSLAAIRVIWAEGKYLYEALQLYDRTAVALGFDQPILPAISGKEPFLDVKVKDIEHVKRDANKWRSLGIRSVFKYSFILATVLFAFSIVCVCIN